MFYFDIHTSDLEHHVAGVSFQLNAYNTNYMQILAGKRIEPNLLIGGEAIYEKPDLKMGMPEKCKNHKFMP